MKTSKRKLAMSITIALVSVLSISIGATTVIRNGKNTHKRFYVLPAVEKAPTPPARVVTYKGELIPLVQLREVIIIDTAIQKKK